MIPLMVTATRSHLRMPRTRPSVEAFCDCDISRELFWSARAERSGDGALDHEHRTAAGLSTAVSPLRSATALQITRLSERGIPALRAPLPYRRNERLRAR